MRPRDGEQNAQLGTVYALDVLADDPDLPGVQGGGSEGDEVTLRIALPGGEQRIASQKGVWHAGVSGQLNLTGSQSFTLAMPLIIK